MTNPKAIYSDMDALLASSKSQISRQAMGLYRIPIRPDKIETIPRVMQSIGFPVVHTERQENGVHYSCANPKRPHKNWTFWITHKTKTHPQFFMCGLSQLSKQLVKILSGADFFDRNNPDRPMR